MRTKKTARRGRRRALAAYTSRSISRSNVERVNPVSESQATFGINLDGNAQAVAASTATAMDHLRGSIDGSSASIKAMSSDMRRLRGSSDEVKSAKADLKAKIDAERDAMSAASLKIIKAGTSYEALTSNAKKLASEQAKSRTKTEAANVEELRRQTEALKSQISGAGGPLSALQSRIGSLGSLASNAAGGLGVAAFALGSLVAVIAMVTSRVIDSGIALGKWIIEGANAARTAGLLREGLTGSAADAGALGTQIDALSKKIPTSKAAIGDLSRSLIDARFSGQTLVDTLNLVGQANAARGDAAGAKLKGMLERSIQANGAEGMFAINPLELQGTGLAFKDVAEGLAVSMGIGVDKARQALLSGAVRMGDAAKGLRVAVEKKFGSLNLRQMLDLNVIAMKFRETLASLTKLVNLEPLLDGFKRLAGLFDENTVTGRAVQGILTRIGDAIVIAFSKGMPIAQQFFYGLIIGSLRLELAFYDVRDAVKKTFGDSASIKGVDAMALALKAGEYAVYGIAAAVLATALAIGLAVTVIAQGADQVAQVSKLLAFGAEAAWKDIKGVWNKLSSLDWREVARQMIDGLVEGLKAGVSRVENAVKDVATAAKNAFTGKGGIDSHSPSVPFRKYGREGIAGGVEAGIDDGSSRVNSAVEGMAKVPSTGGGSGSRLVTIAPVVHFHLGSGGSAEQINAQLPSILAQLTKAIEEAALGAGVPVQT